MIFLTCIFTSSSKLSLDIQPQKARFMGPTWGPPGSCRPQMGPILAPMNLSIRDYTLIVTKAVLTLSGTDQLHCHLTYFQHYSHWSVCRRPASHHNMHWQQHTASNMDTSSSVGILKSFFDSTRSAFGKYREEQIILYENGCNSGIQGLYKVMIPW